MRVTLVGEIVMSIALASAALHLVCAGLVHRRLHPSAIHRLVRSPLPSLKTKMVNQQPSDCGCRLDLDKVST